MLQKCHERRRFTSPLLRFFFWPASDAQAFFTDDLINIGFRRGGLADVELVFDLTASQMSSGFQFNYAFGTTFSEPRLLSVPMRWCYAGGDLTRSKRVDQRTDRSFMRSEGAPKSSLHPPGLASGHTPRSRRATVLPAIKAGAHIKSP